MARVFSAELQTALEKGSVSFRYLVDIHLDDIVYRLGNHSGGEMLIYNGEDYYGLGSIVAIKDISNSYGLAATQGQINLNGALLTAPPEGYETVNSWLRDVLKNDLINRRIVVHEVYEDENGSVVGGIQIDAGVINKTPLNLKESLLTLRYRSNRQKLVWSNGRNRTGADQRRIEPNDDSLDHVGKTAARNGKLAWGFSANSSSSVNIGNGGQISIYDSINSR